MLSNKTRFLLKTACISLIFTVFLSACKNKNQASVAQGSSQVSADFEAFYEKFHKDSAYQMAHIQFPLEGYPADVDSSQIENKFYWQKEDWIMQRLDAFNSSEYTREVVQPMDNAVAEVIRQNNTPFGIYRRFYKRDGEWYLIFYSAMNPMKKE